MAIRNPLYKSPDVALTNAGKCSIEAGDNRRGEDFLKRALTINPANIAAAYNLALLMYRESRARGSAHADATDHGGAQSRPGRALPRDVRRAQDVRPRHRGVVRAAAQDALPRVRRKRRPSRPARARERSSVNANEDVEATGGAATLSAGAHAPSRARNGGLVDRHGLAAVEARPASGAGAGGRTTSRSLPGRTFVRGFMRNYARLLHLDADALLSALPESATAPSLDRPTLAADRSHDGRPALGDRRPSRRARGGPIPLALIAIVAIALAYEFGRPLLERGTERAGRPHVAAAQKASAARACRGSRRRPPPMRQPPRPAPAATAPETAHSEPPTIAAPMAPGTETPLVFVFRGTSWIEVRDAKGTHRVVDDGLSRRDACRRRRVPARRRPRQCGSGDRHVARRAVRHDRRSRSRTSPSSRSGNEHPAVIPRSRPISRASASAAPRRSSCSR